MPICINACNGISSPKSFHEDQIGRFFQNFYNGLSRDHRAWVPYIDEENKFPLLFNFADDELN
jgi:hypothetical protein